MLGVQKKLAFVLLDETSDDNYFIIVVLSIFRISCLIWESINALDHIYDLFVRESWKIFYHCHYYLIAEQKVLNFIFLRIFFVSCRMQVSFSFSQSKRWQGLDPVIFFAFIAFILTLLCRPRCLALFFKLDIQFIELLLEPFPWLKV